MGNVTQYLKWRGDITLLERPFNLPDNLVLAVLSYIDYTDVVPLTGEGITVKEAYEKIKKSGKYAVKCCGDIDISFLQAAAESKRFGGAILSNYCDILNGKEGMQFSAVTIALSDETYYISFRGTDQTLLGWQENFMMTYKKIPAQEEAAKYIDRVISKTPGKYKIGGHSKGANLAVYGAMMCSKESKEHITDVFDNDGPGFTEKLLKSRNYLEIRDRVTRIVPEYCIVGALFLHDSKTIIVKSSADGPMQHHSMTWEILNDSFLTAREHDPACLVVNGIFDEWFENVSYEKREEFTADFFKAAEAGGAKTILDFSKNGIDGLEAVLIAVLRTRDGSKSTAKKLVKSGAEQLKKRIDFKSIATKPNVLRGIFTVVCGLLFMLLSGQTLKIFSYVLMLAVIVFSVYRIIHYFRIRKKAKEDVRIHIISYSLLLTVTLALSFFGYIVEFTSNLILGLLIIVYGIHCIKKAEKMTEEAKKLWWLAWIESVLSVIAGVLAWVAYQWDLSVLYIIIGALIVFKGAYELISEIYKKAKH